MPFNDPCDGIMCRVRNGINIAALLVNCFQNAIHVTRDFLGCATLKRYYAQLHLMNGRFPMGEGGEAAITFTW